MRTFTCVVLAATLGLPSTALALSFKPGLGIYGGWGTYSMSDINHDVQEVNRQLTGTGIRMSEIDNGFDFGLTGSADVGRRFSMGVGYDHLFGAVATDDRARSLVYKLPANALRALAEYRLPRWGQWEPRLGIGGGFVSAFGLVEKASGVKGELDGHGPLGEGYAGVDWWPSPELGLSVSAGYRRARVEKLKIYGQTLRNTDGSNTSLDYSGALLRLGIKLGIGR